MKHKTLANKNVLAELERQHKFFNQFFNNTLMHTFKFKRKRSETKKLSREDCRIQKKVTRF